MAYPRAIFALRLAQTVELVPKHERTPAVRSLVACQHCEMPAQHIVIFSIFSVLANKAPTASCGVGMPLRGHQETARTTGRGCPRRRRDTASLCRRRGRGIRHRD